VSDEVVGLGGMPYGTKADIGLVTGEPVQNCTRSIGGAMIGNVKFVTEEDGIGYRGLNE
jgi:hypothetical protein